MAAAIILIPEMLSGPSHDSTEKPAQTASGGEAAIKTYTIDLNKAPGSQPPTPVAQTDNRAPPPEGTPPPETPSEQPAVQPPVVAQASPEPPVQANPAPAETPKPAPRVEAPPKPEAKPESPKPGPRAVASTPPAPKSAVPTGKGWAVQLASYASEATAERVMKEWRGKGQSAFVMPVTTGGKTLYRVRIGPTKDRDSAEAVLKVVKASIPGAAVVAHP